MVPVAVEDVPGQRQCRHLCVTDTDSGGIGVGVEGGAHTKSGAGGGCPRWSWRWPASCSPTDASAPRPCGPRPHGRQRSTLPRADGSTCTSTATPTPDRHGSRDQPAHPTPPLAPGRAPRHSCGRRQPDASGLPAAGSATPVRPPRSSRSTSRPPSRWRPWTPHPSPARGPRPQQQPALAFIQQRPQRRDPSLHTLDHTRIDRHSDTLSADHPNDRLIYARVLSARRGGHAEPSNPRGFDRVRR